MVITLFGKPTVRRLNRTGARAVPPPFLNDSQWLLIEDLSPHPSITSLGGRPRVLPQECLEGILWVLYTGARWKDLPARSPSPATCWRRLRDWTEAGIWLAAWRRLLSQLDELKGIDWEETMADGTFSPSEKGGAEVGNTKKGKGTKIMLLIDGEGIPLSAFITSANHAEVNTVETLVDNSLLGKHPDHLLYDRARRCGLAAGLAGFPQD